MLLLCLPQLLHGWNPAWPVRGCRTAAPASRAELKDASSTRFTPDVNEGGVNEEVGVYIAPSPGKGFGAWAGRHFDEGVIVGDYVGERLTKRDVAARYDHTEAYNLDDHIWVLSREERGIPTTGRYIYRVEEDLYIDAEDPEVSSWARYINHSKEPNLMGKSLAKSYTGEPRVWSVQSTAHPATHAA